MSTPATRTVPAGTWQLDAAHSSVTFSVRHMMVSKVRGRFTSFSADIVTAEDELASSVTATVDLTSIDTNDAGRDEHLRTSDFFDVANHPKMTFRSTSIERRGDQFALNGDLRSRA